MKVMPTKNYVTILVIISIIVLSLIVMVGGPIGYVLNDPEKALQLANDSAKFNITVVIGLSALAIACISFQTKTRVRENYERIYSYLGAIVYFIILDIGLFFLSYTEPKHIIFLYLYLILVNVFLVILIWLSGKLISFVFDKEKI